MEKVKGKWRKCKFRNITCRGCEYFFDRSTPTATGKDANEAYLNLQIKLVDFKIGHIKYHLKIEDKNPKGRNERTIKELEAPKAEYTKQKKELEAELKEMRKQRKRELEEKDDDKSSEDEAAGGLKKPDINLIAPSESGSKKDAE